VFALVVQVDAAIGTILPTGKGRINIPSHGKAPMNLKNTAQWVD
jgi:hypothetical protein